MRVNFVFIGLCRIHLCLVSWLTIILVYINFLIFIETKFPNENEIIINEIDCAFISFLALLAKWNPGIPYCIFSQKICSICQKNCRILENFEKIALFRTVFAQFFCRSIVQFSKNVP